MSCIDLVGILWCLVRVVTVLFTLFNIEMDHKLQWWQESLNCTSFVYKLITWPTRPSVLSLLVWIKVEIPLLGPFFFFFLSQYLVLLLWCVHLWTTKKNKVSSANNFFFYLGFLPQTFMDHRTAGEGGRRFFHNSSLPLPPASRTLRY